MPAKPRVLTGWLIFSAMSNGSPILNGALCAPNSTKLGMALMGDIPVGVSLYSADVWAEPEIFDTRRSSGAPPEKVFKSDPFTEKLGPELGFPALQLAGHGEG
jgi:hypothetical protein